MSSLAHRFLAGTSWIFLGTVLGQACGLAGSIIAGRLLGKEGFGELGLIRSTISIFFMVAVFGIGMAATKYISEYRQTAKERLGRIIGFTRSANTFFSILCALAIAISAPYLAAKLFNAPQLTYPLILAASIVFLQSVFQAEQGIISGFQSFRELALLNIAQPLLQAGLYFL